MWVGQGLTGLRHLFLDSIPALLRTFSTPGCPSCQVSGFVCAYSQVGGSRLPGTFNARTSPVSSLVTRKTFP